jgi:hypothetical protein
MRRAVEWSTSRSLVDALALRQIQGCRARRHGRGAAARGLAAVAMENVLITPHTAVR